ncbi:ABC transporter ATP-binding protein [Rhizobium tumorigenes]|uniref:ABC transporter ATP-binding protein n=1 Tax=Rhizobium tumorigenes TaxID=2041385 RepID=A0AAF1KX09_9HYPH|nr:ABC transporter ATP-binding protein [Rhizobium tumorigenes]WFR98634.1 ABC transporter ATP-binding protein [Rhizobium tumorigenes]
MTDIILTVSALKATYNNAVSALHGVNLTVGRGEIVALLGSNGAGKSTTLKAISNLLPAQRGQITEGSILFEGVDVLKVKPSELVRNGLVQVLEGRHCFKSLSVEENLICGGIGRGSKRADLNDDLEKVYVHFPRLREKRHTLAGLTSGGEQQMTAIGRALMARPRLLVLDEPSMGLAPLVVQSIFRTLRQINRDTGLSVLVAEQNSTVALKFADRASVLENGITVLSGKAKDLAARNDIKAFYLGHKAISTALNSQNPIAAAVV